MKISYFVILVFLILNEISCTSVKKATFSPNEIKTVSGVIYDRYLYRPDYPADVKHSIFGFWYFENKMLVNDTLYSVINESIFSLIPFKCKQNKRILKYFSDKKISFPLLELDKFDDEIGYWDTITNDLYNFYKLQCETLELIKPYCILDTNVLSRVESLKFYCPSSPDTSRYPLLIPIKSIRC